MVLETFCPWDAPADKIFPAFFGSRPRPFSWICAGLMGLGFFLVLFRSLLPDPADRANYGGDGGDFLAAMLTGGIPIPTGSRFTPAWQAFSAAAGLNALFRVALLSAGAVALAVALAFRWVCGGPGVQVRYGTPGWRRSRSRGLGSSPMFWSQAVIVEVHALQALFFLMWLGWISALLAWDKWPGSAVGLAAFSSWPVFLWAII